MQTTRNIFLKAVAAAVLASTAGLASAAGSTTVDVTAKVSAACKFTAASMTAIDLGTIDPSTVSAAVTGTSNITYQCTKGTTPAVSITSGGTSLVDGAKSIPYTFSLGTAEAGVGFSGGSAKVVATATIAKTDAQDAAAGTAYADTVTLTIDN